MWEPMPQQQNLRVDGHEGAGHGGSGSYGGGDRGGEGGGWGESPGQRGMRETGSITGQELGAGPEGGDTASVLNALKAMLNFEVPGTGFLDEIKRSPGYKAHQKAQAGALLAGPLGAFGGLIAAAATDWANASPEEREAMRADARAMTVDRQARQASGDTGDVATNRVPAAGAEIPTETPTDQETEPTPGERMASIVDQRMAEWGLDAEVTATEGLTYDPNWLNPLTSALDQTRSRIRTLGVY